MGLDVSKYENEGYVRINLKKGFKRLGLAIGYIIFAFFFFTIGSYEAVMGSSSLSGAIWAWLGIKLFEIIIKGIGWIKEGFSAE